MSEPVSRAHVTIELRGELDVDLAAKLGAILSAAVSRRPVIEVDLSPRGAWTSADLPFWVMTWTV